MPDEKDQRSEGVVPRSSILVGAIVLSVVLGLQVTGSFSGKSATGRALGMGNQAGGCNPEMIAEQVPLPEGVEVARNDIPEQITRREAPQDQPEGGVDGDYVIKLNPGTGPKGKLADVTSGFTGVPAVDVALEDLGVRGFKNVYLDGEAKRIGGGMVGAERVFEFSSDEISDAVLEVLEGLDEVEWIEPVQQIKKFEVPNDPYFSYQWNMTTLGVTTAWRTTAGDGVTVAVVDTGVSAGSDGFDNLLVGYDFHSRDADASDEDGHGTHVAGTIAQATNNGNGTVGVAPDVAILPVRVLGPNGGSSTDVAAGIVWAVDQGADVINLSLGGGGYSYAMADACDYAYNNGVVVIAASGNDGYSNLISYPAGYDNVVAVGASGMDGNIAYYSNYGPGIDITAPGGDVTADLDGDGYGDGILQETLNGAGGFGFYFFQGTSMAAPHVAGVAALLVANGLTEVDDVYQALFDTADDMGTPGYDEVFGHGIVNPVSALEWGAPPPPESLPPLEITRTRFKTVRSRRGAIIWETSEPASTVVEGSNGFFFEDPDAISTHRVVVRAKPNEQVEFTFRSVDALGREVSDSVMWPFE